MAIICGIDLEGINQNLELGGVNLAKDRITEIGAVLWDVELKQPVKILSELINEPDHLPITEEIAELTGITDDMLENWGADREEIPAILTNLKNMMERADYIMAHNGDQYDKPMLGAMFNRFGIPMPDKLWIDSIRDIEFPKKIKVRALSQLEHAHGFVNPFPHRALSDVFSMLKLAANYDLDRMVTLAKSPLVTIIAKLSSPNWSDPIEMKQFNQKKHKISKARFKWNPSNKTWTKIVHQVLLDEGKISFDFEWALK
jgi:DNA polymerase-3 subunit epsilon